MSAAPGPRVVSLVPSATETLLAWGITPVAVTRFCEHPELPAVGGTKDPDLEAVVALRPDVVVMCIEENRREDALALEAAGLAVHAIDLDTVDDVGPALARLADAVGVGAAAAEADVAVGTRTAGPPVRAFVPIWRRPWMTMSGRCYGSSVLDRLGVRNVFADAEDRYPEVTLDEAIATKPDVVLAPSEPYPFRARHVPELEVVAPVVLVDGQDLFWWGVRTPAALDRLGAQLAHLRL